VGGSGAIQLASLSPIKRLLPAIGVNPLAPDAAIGPNAIMMYGMDAGT